MKATPNLIASAEAVINLWDLHLFTAGTKEARMKRADILQEAIIRLQADIAEAKNSEPS